MSDKHNIKIGSKWQWKKKFTVDCKMTKVTVTGYNMQGHIVYVYEDGIERHKTPSLFLNDMEPIEIVLNSLDMLSSNNGSAKFGAS